MNILTENTSEEKTLKSISCFFKEYSVDRPLKKANAYKRKGIPIAGVFIYLVQLVFTKKSMNILTDTHNAGFAKDVVYRLMNSSFINWSSFLLSLAACVINSKIENLTFSDDTLYSRSRSNNVELLTKVYDHFSKAIYRYKKGFQQLTLVWSDGVTLIPLLFRHMSSEKKKNRYNEIKSDIDKRSCGYKARLQALSTKPKVLLGMLGQVSKVGVPAKHVLFDSWFSYPATIIEIAKLNFKVVARVKNTPKIKYLLNGDNKTLSQIYGSAKKRRGKSKYFFKITIDLNIKVQSVYY